MTRSAQGGARLRRASPFRRKAASRGSTESRPTVMTLLRGACITKAFVAADVSRWRDRNAMVCGMERGGSAHARSIAIQVIRRKSCGTTTANESSPCRIMSPHPEWCIMTRLGGFRLRLRSDRVGSGRIRSVGPVFREPVSCFGYGRNCLMCNVLPVSTDTFGFAFYSICRVLFITYCNHAS